MATWPSTLTYSESSYSWESMPVTSHTRFASENTRQRKLRKKRDDMFSVTLTVDATQLDTFETFVLTTLNNGADTYTGPYFVSDSEYTGTLQIINGEYTVRYLSENYWEVSYQFEVKDRSTTEEGNIYGLVNEYSGFTGLYDIIAATEDAVNNNNL
jgi:hypothetical protein